MTLCMLGLMILEHFCTFLCALLTFSCAKKYGWMYLSLSLFLWRISYEPTKCNNCLCKHSWFRCHVGKNVGWLVHLFGNILPPIVKSKRAFQLHSCAAWRTPRKLLIKSWATKNYVLRNCRPITIDEVRSWKTKRNEKIVVTLFSMYCDTLYKICGWSLDILGNFGFPRFLVKWL